MEDLNIYPSSGSVFFGQIYGMCDYISNTLGKIITSTYSATTGLATTPEKLLVRHEYGIFSMDLEVGYKVFFLMESCR